MHLKKLHRAERGAKIVEVFRVKNNDFMQKNHIFSNFRGGLSLHLQQASVRVSLNVLSLQGIPRAWVAQ